MVVVILVHGFKLGYYHRIFCDIYHKKQMKDNTDKVITHDVLTFKFQLSSADVRAWMFQVRLFLDRRCM